MNRRIVASLVAVAVGALALTSCAPQSRDAVDDYQRVLSAVPGVIDVSVGISTPLPFTVQASVEAVIPADVDVLDALITAACAEQPNASVRFDLVVRDGGVDVRSAAGEDCPEVTHDVVAIAADAGASTSIPDVRIDIADRLEGATQVEITDYADLLDVADVLPLADIVVAHLDVARVSVDADDVELPMEDQNTVAQRIADLRTVAEMIPIEEVALSSDGLVLTIAETGAAQASVVEATLRDLPSMLWTDVDIAVTGATDAPGADAGPDGTRLVTWIQDELGLAATATSDTVSVRVDDIDALVEAAESIAARNDAGLRVVFLMDGDTAFRVSGMDRFILTASDNPYPRWAEWWQEFADTGEVSSVEVGHEGLSVWLNDGVEADQRLQDRIGKIAARIATDAGLSWYRVNNTSITL